MENAELLFILKKALSDFCYHIQICIFIPTSLYKQSALATQSQVESFG